MKNLFLLFLCLFLSALCYSQEAFIINDYQIEIVIDEFGACQITENIDLNFSERRRGIIREVPLEGKFKTHKQRLRINDVEVEGQKFKVTQKGDYLNIRIGDPDVYLAGPVNYQISYKAVNGLLNFENHEEFYWTLIGPEWDADITNAGFKIQLPKPIRLSNDDLQLFSGSVGENTTYGKISQLGDGSIDGSSLVTLGNGKGLTVGLRFPKGYFFDNPNAREEHSESLRFKKDKSYPLPILLLISLFAAFRKWGRNNIEFEGVDNPYFPPEDMSSAEVGAFYDNKVNNRDLISLIPKWGQEGYLKVKVLNNEDVYLERIGDAMPDGDPHEQYFFDELFRGKQLVFVDELKNEFYTEFNKAKSLLKKDVNPGLYDQQAVKWFHSWRMIVLSLVFVIIGIAFLFGFKQLYAFLGFLVLSIAAFVIKYLEPKKSERGLRVHGQLQSLYAFLEDPDPGLIAKISNEDPAYLEKIFPYVVAFGLEEQFSKQFEGLSQKAPDWYYYEDGRPFMYTDFHRDFNTGSIGKTMSSMPVADSGSSSFGGSSGGSVGGGFGGGGGSSW